MATWEVSSIVGATAHPTYTLLGDSTGEYRLSALSLPEGYYVKEVQLNGVDVQNRAMQFSPFVPNSYAKCGCRANSRR